MIQQENDIFGRAVHVNRLKLAHIRMPFPETYFRPNDENQDNKDELSESLSEFNKESDHTENDANNANEIVNEQNKHVDSRPKRNIRKPARYRDDDHVDPDNLEELSQPDIATELDGGIKIKRILAKKKDGGSFLYLVQKSGEPAQNAVWLTGSNLPPKANEMILNRHPPLID